MKPSAVLTRAGNRLLDRLPPKAATQMWKVFQGTHVAVYRASNGRLGSSFGDVQILLLHHVGRRSGEARLSPLLYLEHEGDPVIIASKGGHPKHPAWYHNLMAAPDTEVEMRGERRAIHARQVEGDEREGIWHKAVAVWPDYDAYKARTDREIPVILLERR